MLFLQLTKHERVVGVPQGHRSLRVTRLNSLGFFRQCFVAAVPTKQFAWATKPFSALAQISGNSRGVSGSHETAADAGTKTGDSPMRTISFILAFAFILAGPSMAGSSDQGLPGIGTFAYNGPAVAPAPVMIAATN
jgi:hypothetical protein